MLNHCVPWQMPTMFKIVLLAGCFVNCQIDNTNLCPDVSMRATLSHWQKPPDVHSFIERFDPNAGCPDQSFRIANLPSTCVAQDTHQYWSTPESISSVFRVFNVFVANHSSHGIAVVNIEIFKELESRNRKMIYSIRLTPEGSKMDANYVFEISQNADDSFGEIDILIVDQPGITVMPSGQLRTQLIELQTSMNRLIAYSLTHPNYDVALSDFDLQQIVDLLTKNVWIDARSWSFAGSQCQNFPN